MTKILTNPKAIKRFIKHVIQVQLEAYFECLNDDSEMLLVITDTPVQVDKIKSFLLRSQVLSDRRSLTVCTQPFPKLSENHETAPFFGIFYVSEHEKEDRAKIMNNVLTRAIARILASN
jgi:hypothetical protein